ncbi:MAG: DUF4127 family protein [Armatimonadia bacterium]|nr:DUF4127 family protein [Armatimonadia bacterium]
MRVALLPLDDRPCHTRFPARLAEAAGIELLLPPRELLGWFDRPGDPDGVLDWLEDAATSCDALAVCVEMATCGGLVTSRRSGTAAQAALDRLDRMAAILPLCPGPKYLGSVIMRATVTVSAADQMDAYARIARYSELRESADSGDREALGEIRSIEQSLPPGVLDDYLAARERNHSVNLRCVDLAAGGIVDGLVLTQEDCRPRGIHRREQAALLRRAACLDPGRVLLHPGADELSMALLARAAVAVARIQPRARVRLLPPEGGDRIAPFEDQPIRGTVDGQARAAGVALVEARRAPLLAVIAPLEGPTDLTGDDYPASRGGSTDWIREGLDTLAGGGGPLVLADCAVANGAHLPVLDALADHPARQRLLAYLAWNTAGNTLGTATALLALLPLMPDGYQALERFRFERLVDDAIYQSVVRAELVRWVEDRGGDPHRMSPSLARAAEEWLSARLIAAAEGRGWVPKGLTWDIALPWDRTFECDVELRPEPAPSMGTA